MSTNNLLKIYLNSSDYFEYIKVNICENIACDNWAEVIISLAFINKEWLIVSA